MSQSIVAVLHGDAVYGLKEASVGPRLHETVKEHLSTKLPQSFGVGFSHCWIIGSDTSETTQVYVVQEHTGRRIFKDKQAEQSDLDALVDVLRSHGYTCRRTSQP